MVLAGIVAGGTGTRMGGDLPKQFYELDGKPVLLYTAERFLKHPDIDAVIIGIHPDWYQETQSLIQRHLPGCRNIFLTCGGSDRNETVSRIISLAKSELSCTDSDIILTHDAVRPFVSQRLITDSISAMSRFAICTAVIPETDTVVVSQDGSTAADFPDRSTLYRVQTPQTFRLGGFHQIYESLSDSEKRLATDVCRLYQRNGDEVGLIEGDITNIKLTYPLDYQIARWQAATRVLPTTD